MLIRICAALFMVLVCTSAHADLKPDIIDCNAKKAARNAAMEATVGVSGGCDSKKVAKKSKENATDNVKDAVGVDGDKNKVFKDEGEGKGILKKKKD